MAKKKQIVIIVLSCVVGVVCGLFFWMEIGRGFPVKGILNIEIPYGGLAEGLRRDKKTGKMYVELRMEYYLLHKNNVYKLDLPPECQFKNFKRLDSDQSGKKCVAYGKIVPVKSGGASQPSGKKFYNMTVSYLECY